MRFELPSEPHLEGVGRSAIETVIIPRARDLGGFEVRRALPSARRRMVGPFVFFDQMGPAVLRPGQGLDVRPHPHIGLATVTYLFDGALLHRDSLGTVQPIRPGEVNVMTAGRGIVHSERTPPEAREEGGRLFGVQLWLALPEGSEEAAPSFEHTPASRLPWAEDDGGVSIRLVLGELFGARSPSRIASPSLLADVTMEAQAELPFHADCEERALYVAEGAVEVDGARCDAGRLAVFRPGAEVTLEAVTGARVLLLGGEPLGRRYIWWNFVSSSPERIEQAAADWAAVRFEAVPEETESIPLPDTEPPRVARYP